MENNYETPRIDVLNVSCKLICQSAESAGGRSNIVWFDEEE